MLMTSSPSLGLGTSVWLSSFIIRKIAKINYIITKSISDTLFFQQYLAGMNEEVTKMTTEKIESMMYQIENTHFQNFSDMIKYLESADSLLTDKIQRIDLKIQTVNEQFVRTSSVYEMNNKKRQKEQQLLKLERDRISKDLEVHKERLSEFKLSPITLSLKQKKYELEKLLQTKEIIQEFSKLVKGKEDEVKKILPLDEKNFNNSALKIYVFKVLLEDIHGVEYENAKLEINKKYSELKNKIIQNFKEGYWNKDTKLIRNTLPYCEQYELLDEISQFYNEQIFKSVHKVTKLAYQVQSSLKSMKDAQRPQDSQDGQGQIKNMFFLIEQGFYGAFSPKDETTGEINPNQINNIMGQYSESVGRKLVTYVFEKIIRDSLEKILKQTSTLLSGTALYLSYLEIFFDECKKLMKSAEKIIKQDRTIHLMSTYFESIFDSYLDTYLNKELNNLDETYEKCTQQITKDISENAANGTTQFIRDREKNNIFSQDKKNAIKNIFQYAIESKKNIFQGGISKGDALQSIAAMNQAIRLKIQNLLKIFMSPSLERIFSTTKKALARNKKMAKINQIDRNRNEILQLFLSNVEQIIQNMISLISQVVPPFDEKAPSLDPDFFQLVPQINMLLHRVEFMYEEYKKQNCYRLADTIKLDQNKQNLMVTCGKSLNKVVAEAMATILASEGYILQQDFNQYNIVNPDKAPPNKSCPEIISFLQRYIKVIQKITLNNFRTNILKTLGLQFVNHLIRYYSQIPYTKQGLSKIFMDIAKYKTVISQFYNEEVEGKFKILRSLIDIYVIKNDEKAIEDYLKVEQNLSKLEHKKTIEAYVLNKFKCQKTK